jgi:hypothetical protein
LDGEPRASLLDDVRQFVRQQALACVRPRRVLARAKDNVAPDCISQRIDSARGFSRPAICMDAHVSKIMSDPPLEIRP